MKNVENTVGRKPEGCLFFICFFPQAVIRLADEWRRFNDIAQKITPEMRELNANLRMLHADLQNSRAVDEAARIGEALEDLREIVAPILDWNDKGTTRVSRGESKSSMSSE